MTAVMMMAVMTTVLSIRVRHQGRSDDEEGGKKHQAAGNLCHSNLLGGGAMSTVTRKSPGVLRDLAEVSAVMRLP